MNNKLILLTGADIPFIEGTATLHQPTLYEISFLGEAGFFTGCELLRFSKEMLTDEDKTNLTNYNDFHILMSIINDYSDSMAYNVSCALTVLDLIFPKYTVKCAPLAIELLDVESGERVGAINEMNFSAFKDILADMFCLKMAAKEPEYNVQGVLAQQIADKLKNRHKQLAERSNSLKNISIFSRYISILTVGECKDMLSFMKYTVYQLFDEFQRFELKRAADMTWMARLAGATGLQDPEDWTKDLH